jgi:tetratricopeptide (TPR) repeat protein
MATPVVSIAVISGHRHLAGDIAVVIRWRSNMLNTRGFLLLVLGLAGAGAAFTLLTRPGAGVPREKTLELLKDRLSSDGDRDVRGTTARSLGKIGDRSAVQALLLAYQKDASIMTEVVEAFIEMNIAPAEIRPDSSSPSRIHDGLVVLKDALLKIDLKIIAAYAMAWSVMISVGSAVSSWRSRRFKSRAGLFRHTLWVALTNLSSIAVIVMITYAGLSQVRQRDQQPEPKTAEMLSVELARKTRDHSSVSWLMSLLADTDRPVELRRRAAQALGAIADSASVAALQTAAQADEPLIRIYAVWALGNVYTNDQKKREDELTQNWLNEQAIKRLSDVLMLSATNATAYARRGRAYAALGRYQDAISDFDKALVYSVSGRAEIYSERAMAFATAGRTMDAVADYTQALKDEPKFAFAYLGRGLAYSSLKRFTDAAADLQNAVRLDPGSFETRLSLADVYVQVGRSDEALAEYAKCSDVAGSELDRETVKQRLAAMRTK